MIFNFIKIIFKIYLNQEHDILFRTIKKMFQIFDYMVKYEKKINYLLNVIEYCDQIYEKKIKTDKFTSSQNLFYQIYTFALIRKNLV